MFKSIIDRNDLFIAYKKAKFELFSDKNSVTTLKLLDYERNLEDNLCKLLDDIFKNGLKNIKCESYFEIPKSLTLNNKDEKTKNESHFFSSSLKHNRAFLDEENSKIELSFRKYIDADINFHIISALWISKVGQYIDEKFDKNIYGARLTRIKPIDTSSCEFDLVGHQYNLDSPRIFESYQHKYTSWRNNSFKAIRELHKSSSVIAITMDITSFYHSVILEEFLEENFYKEFNLDEKFEENSELKIFHEQFINCLKNWNIYIKSDYGLPIGLSASPILANATMRDFDKKVIENLAPTYYGRYVDDILLVFPDNGNITNGEDVIKYLLNKEIVEMKETEENILFYKHFKLKKEKQKIFYLDKNSDLSIIDGIESEINSISSEWRFMPDISDSNSSLLNKIIGFYADGKEFNDALRKIDATTIKRLGLSLLISHSHSLNQYVNPSEWEEQRNKIYDLIENHIFIPKNFFDNFTFLSKIFRLMIHSNDGQRAYCFLNKVFELIKKLENATKNISSSNGKTMEFYEFKKFTYYVLQESLIETLNISNKIIPMYLKKIIDKLFKNENTEDIQSNILLKIYEEVEIEKEITISADLIKIINKKLFFRDLSFDSFSSNITEYILSKNKNHLLNKLIRDSKDFIKYINLTNFEINLADSYIEFSDIVHKLTNFKIPIIPLILPTRLFSPLDISIICPLLSNEDFQLFRKFINTLRGTHIIEETENKEKEVVAVKNKSLNTNIISIAITNFKVNYEYWEKSVIQKPIKSIERYSCLESIIKEAVKKKPDYLIFPELALPQEWAFLVAKKLLANNISLITGVEYIHDGEGFINNSMMMFLVSDDIGFKHIKFFRQDKTVGAHGEIKELFDMANIKLKAEKKYENKNIYKHGNFYFSSLICNELTDIKYRYDLRGKIDALFVLEWNRDIKSFNALVESSALDIHAYVIQVNNRIYGDSRIRAPFTNDYERDIVQVRGGKHDYLIVGEIDIKSLREFQSHNISPNKPFKPVPTGFKMLKSRETWSNEYKNNVE
jgi:hypothetical protein